MRGLLRLLATPGLTLVLGACAAAGTAPTDGGMVDVTGDWQLSRGMVDGVPFPVVADAPITMTVQGAQISGRSACNHYGGEIVVEGGSVRRH